MKPISTLCVCTIDSYTASAAVVKLFGGEDSVRAPVVLFSASEKVQGETLGDVAHAFKIVLEKARSHGGNPGAISCVIGEPWVATVPQNLRVEKTGPFAVTKKLISDELARAVRLAEMDIRKNFPNADVLSILDISEPIFEVNGYRADNPAGSTVPSLAILQSVSVMESETLNEIGLAISEVFHRDDISFHSRDHALAHFVSDEKILSLSVGGASTQWSVIDRGNFAASESAPEGLAEIEREACHEFSVPRTLVDSTMEFATDESLVANEGDVYYRRIERCAQPWIRSIRESFERLQKRADLLPKTVVMSSSVPWTKSLAPVVARELGAKVAVMGHLSESPAVVFAHEAHDKTTALAIAAQYATFRMNAN